jgi:hypothetical protein
MSKPDIKRADYAPFYGKERIEMVIRALEMGLQLLVA